MKFRMLDIEHFGVFSQRRVEFSADRLQLVYGPNEAGKSTLLELMREVLFGFQVRNRYAFSDHAGEMAVTVMAELAAGDRIRYRRRKGRKREVVGENLTTGQPFDAQGLARLLGGAGPELFRNVFGFSVAELMAGEKSLANANISEALFGTAMGGLADFQQLMSDLETEKSELFLPSATKRPINRMLSSIRKQESELRAAQVRPRRYEQMQQELDQLQAEVDRIRDQRVQLQRQETQTSKLVDAVDVWNQRQQLRSEFEQLTIPAQFPLDGDEQYARAKTQVADTQRELQDFQQEQKQVAGHMARLCLRPEMMEQEAVIQQFQQQLDKIRGFRQDIVLRQQEAETIRSAVLTKLRDLDPGWGFEQLETFRTNVANRTAIEQLAEEHDQMTRRRSELISRRADVEVDIAAHTSRIEELDKTPDQPVLAELIESAADYQANQQRLADRTQQCHASDATIASLQQKLQAPFANELTDCQCLPVPMIAVVDQFRRRWEKVVMEVERSCHSLQEAQKHLRQQEEALANLLAVENVPDREQLLEARAHRDQGWGLIREKFVEGQTLSSKQIAKWSRDSSTSLVEAYESSVTEADELADRRQEKAELVAREEQLRLEVDRAQARQRVLKEQWQHACGERDTCQEQWERLWEPCALQPKSPEAMAEWLRLHDELIEAVRERNVLHSQIDSLQSQLQEFETELRAALGQPADSPTTLLAIARQRIERAREAASERRTYLRELPRKQHELDSVNSQLAVIDQAEQEWLDRWEPLMRQFGFPAAWSVHAANRVLQGLSEARVDFERAQALEQRVADMQSGLDQFDHEVSTLVAELRPELNQGPSENAVEELVRLLEESKQNARDHVNLVERRKLLEERIAAKQQQVVSCQKTLNDLLARAEVKTEEQLLEVAAAVRHWHELNAEIAALDQQLRLIQGYYATGDFEAALDQADKAELIAQRDMFRAQLEQTDEQYAEATKRLGIAAEGLRVLEQTSQAADMALDLENQRGELRAAVDRWVPLVLAQSLMRRALQRFQAEHQPRLLSEVSDMFQTMTMGRYVGIARKLDEQGTLQLQPRDGPIKEPDQLSTGTREQLYLAIRLAYVLQYCRDTEPLPLIMDDVLVNFDDQRAQSTLKVLQEISQQLQVILLTCHQSTIDLARSFDAQLRPIELDV